MKNILKYLPYALCLLLFFAGRYSAPDDSKEVERKFEQERKTFTDAIREKDSLIVRLLEESEQITKRMKSDSAFFAHSLQQNKRAYNDLKRKYNEINLGGADAHVLDSLLSRLYTE